MNLSWQISLILIAAIVTALIIGQKLVFNDTWQCPKCKKTGIKKGDKKITKWRGTWGETKIITIACECKNCGHKWQTKEEIDRTINT